MRARDFVILKLPARQKVAACWCYHCFGRKKRILRVEEFKKESQRMALFHFKQTRAADMMSDSSTLRVKPDEKLMRTRESSQTSCCSSWSPPGDQERTRGGRAAGRDVHLADVDLGLVLLQTVGEEMAKIQQERTRGGRAGGRDVHLADVDLGLVLLQTVGEEMAKIQQERTQWVHRMSGS